MKLLLVRHGESRTREENPGLTEDGREVVLQQALKCRDNQVKVDQIRHSEKKRAAETAKILAEHLKPSQGVVEIKGLMPYDDIVPIAESLQEEESDLMYVGHLPFLFELVDQLLGGEPGVGMHKFGNANIVCLLRENGKWTVEYTMPEELKECWLQKSESSPAEPER